MTTISSGGNYCCYEVPIAEDMRLREGERRCSRGGGTLYIRCLLVYLPIEEQVAYIENT